MAIKKVYFYQVNIFRVSDEQEVSYRLIKDLFNDIIESRAVRQDGYRTLDLTLDNDPMHIMMDIFRYQNDTLFCRLSKQKPNNSMIQRNYDTFEHKDILPGISEDTQGIENYTYCSLNYEKGILSIISALGAPNEKAVGNAILKYNNRYYIELVPVPNTEAIQTIYFGEESAITKIEIEVPVPAADIMKEVLGWNEEEITATVTENALTTAIVVKPPRRKALTEDTEDTQRFIDCIKSAMPSYSRAKITGKAKNIKSQEYDLFAEYFSYPIDIASYYIENGKRVWYSVEQLTTNYNESLKFAFSENKILIETLTGRAN